MGSRVVRAIALAIGAMLWPVWAIAQAPAAPDVSQILAQAAFAPAPSPSPIQVHGDMVAASSGQVFATPDFVAEGLTGQPVSTGRVAAVGEGVIAWRTSEVSRPTGDGTVDSVRLSTASISRAPFGAQGAVYDPDAVNVTFTRGWPALLVRAGGLGINVTPHAGIGFDSGGGQSAEAGAMIKFSSLSGALRDRLEAMGVKDGASSYGQQGRWYLFAAVRGQAVGLNMQETAGALRRTGWSTDISSALVGDGQVGVGWRKGGMEASFGYVHRGIHLQGAPQGASDSYADDMAALAFTYHPHW